MTQKTINILHITATVDIGGQEKLLLDLIAHMPDSFWHTVWYYLPANPESNFIQAYLNQGARRVEYQNFPKTKFAPFRFLKNVFFFYHSLKNTDFDIIHYHSKTYLLAIQLAVFFLPKKKFVANVHSEYFFISPLKRFILSIYYNLLGFGISRIICVSNAVKKDFVLKYRKMTIYNGIDTTRFSPAGDNKFELRKELFNLDDSVIVFITVANLRPNIKGYEYLVPAFLKFLDSFLNCHLIIVGTGDQKYLTGWLNTVKAEKNIHLIGTTDRIPELLKASDVYICASEKEAISLSVLEAMATGLPVLSTDAGGVPEAVLNGENGIIVKKKSADDLHRGLISMMRQKDLWATWGTNCRSRAERMFDIKTTASRYAALYNSIIPETD